MRMTYISLCSGVEAATLAWEPLEWMPVAFAEVDPFASAVLAARFPDVPNLGDLTKVDWDKYRGTANVVIAGFPCQSFSISGLRKGLDDPRGQIMLECLSAVSRIDPEWAVLENVPGLLSADRGRCFETLLNAVAILWPGGGISWRILDSQWFGSAQRRRRVFAVINTRDWRRAAAVLLNESCLRGHTPTRQQAWETVAANTRKRTEEAGGDGGLTAFKWFAGAKARTMPAYDDGTTPTPTNSDAHQPAIAFAQNQRDEVRLIGGDGAIAGTVQSQVWGTHKNETLIAEPTVMASGQAHAEISTGGGCTDDSGSELQRPANPVRATTSNGADVFPSLCATDGSKQFIDNQSVNGGRLLLDPRREWP